MIHTVDPDLTLHHGDALEVLSSMPADSSDCVITSPAYWGLRDYGTGDQQHGLEPTPHQYIQRMVQVFREVRRVLAPHGTCWVNIGDSYASGEIGRHDRGRPEKDRGWAEYDYGQNGRQQARLSSGLKPKDLVGIPWRLAFALQADGWYLRADIIWSKPNPMPESVTDRPTKAHEYVFLLTKGPRYWFDQEAVREPSIYPDDNRKARQRPEDYTHRGRADAKGVMTINPDNARTYPARNVRSVWEISTQPFPQAHFATFPEELVRRCLLAGCPLWVCRVCGKPRERIVERGELVGTDRGGNYKGREAEVVAAKPAGTRLAMNPGTPGLAYENTTLGWSDCGCTDYTLRCPVCNRRADMCFDHGDDWKKRTSPPTKWRPGVVLDPFVGSGTVPLVARKHGRHSIGIDLNEKYLTMAAERCQQLSLLSLSPTSEAT